MSNPPLPRTTNQGEGYRIPAGFGRVDALPIFGSTPPAMGDYDGDGRTGLAVRDPVAFLWYILESRTGQVRIVPFGL